MFCIFCRNIFDLSCYCVHCNKHYINFFVPRRGTLFFVNRYIYYCTLVPSDRTCKCLQISPLWSDGNLAGVIRFWHLIWWSTFSSNYILLNILTGEGQRNLLNRNHFSCSANSDGTFITLFNHILLTLTIRLELVRW